MQLISLVVGLGNPGIEYKQTRHNIGAVWVTQLLHSLSGPSLSFHKKFQGLFAKWMYQSNPCYFLLPATFMNKSGESVLAVSHFYKISAETVVIVHDDMDLKVGQIRLKQNGGDAGHNGIKDIIRCLGSSNFFRLRIGIGRPVNFQTAASYVLQAPSLEEQKILNHTIARSVALFPDLFNGHFEKVMQELHQK